MDPHPKRPLLRWLFRLSLAGAACLLGIAIGLVVGRKEIATRLANDFLADYRLEKARIHVAALERDHCEIVDVEIATDSAELSIERIVAQYSLNEVRENRRLGKLNIEGVKLSYDLTGPSTFDPQSLDSLIKEGLPFPLESLNIRQAGIELLMDFGTIVFDADLELWQENVSKIQGTLNARTPNESIELALAIEDTIDFDAEVAVDNLLTSLERYGIALEDYMILPEGSRIRTSDANARATGSFEGIEPKRIELETRLGPARLQDPLSDIAIASIEAKAAWKENALGDLSATLQIENARMESLRLGSSRIDVVSEDLQDWQGSMSETAWSVDETLSGAVQLETSLKLSGENSLESLRAKLDVPKLNYDAHSVEPFSLSLEGTLDRFILNTSALSSRQLPWLSLAPTRIELAALATQDATVTLNTTLSAKAAEEDSATPPPIEGSWKLAAHFSPNQDPQTLGLTLVPSTEDSLISTAGLQVAGNGSLEIEARHWARERELAAIATGSASGLQFDTPAFKASGLSLDASLETKPISLEELSSVIKTKEPKTLAQLLAEYISYRFELQGAQAMLGDALSLQWFAAGMESSATNDANQPLGSALHANIGIANAAQESLQQISLHGNLSSNLEDHSFQLAGNLLFEGETARFDMKQAIRFDDESLKAEGSFSIQDIRLISSDILTRYSPSMIGTAVSANIGIVGKSILENESLSIPAEISVEDGSLTQSANDVALKSIQGTIVFDSLLDATTLPSQVIQVANLNIGDIDATDLRVAFQLDESNRLIVEDARVQTFDGMLALEPFSLSLEDPQAAIILNFNRISVAPAIAMLDFFDGNVTGRLNGSLPISIVDGYPVLGEGFLELDPDSDARFSYNAQGYFTDEGGPDGTKKALGDKLLDRLELEPNGLLERALGNLTISDLRVDLFSKDLPDTPMRIQLAGIADAGNAEIPLNITTNVNGTVAELLNFLMRLDSLGLVTE